MGLDKRTIKIVVIVCVVVIIIATVIGIVSGLLVSDRHELRLEVWPRSEDNVEEPLIAYKATDRSSWDIWVQRINEFLKQYLKKGSDNRVMCSYNSGPVGEKQVCDVPVDDFHPCTPSNQYNYERAAPCVFLKLNEILNWQPQPFNKSIDLPQTMPQDLKQHITMVSGRSEANTVWVSCEGENPADVENMGPMQYIPRRGFPSYYYPFTNKEGYLSPLVAVLFERPKTGVLIRIECKAWAKNIINDRYEGRGSVRFNLMVDGY